jgi:antitoxin component YwqK of YwqJK toxin-antitoxin module
MKQIIFYIIFSFWVLSEKVVCQENKFLFSIKDSADIAYSNCYYNYCSSEYDSLFLLKTIDSLENTLIDEVQTCTVTRVRLNKFFQIRGYYDKELRFQYFTDLLGLNQGKFTIYHNDGSIECDVDFVDNKIEGVLKYRITDKFLFTQEYVHGIKHGNTKDFKKGKLIYFVNYKNGLKDGLEVEFNVNNDCLKTYKLYQNGKVKDGIYDYYSDCSLLEWKYFYKKNIIKKIVFYDEDGNITRTIKGKKVVQN